MRAQDSGSTGMTPPRTTHSLTHGVTTARLSASLTTDGKRKARSLRRSSWSAQAAMSARVFVTRAHQSRWMILPICVGSAEAARSGTPGPVSTLVPLHPTTGYWSKEHEKASRRFNLLPNWSRKHKKTFLDEDYCAIDDEDFFVRGIIHLPIIGAAETFRWGVWGSLSRENFAKLRQMNDDPKRTELQPMFSWLSTQIPEYPDTLSLKMYAHIQEPSLRPTFSLEPTDHPLSQQYHKGISPEQVKEIMLGRLRKAD
jgi:hypothetical protein